MSVTKTMRSRARTNARSASVPLDKIRVMWSITYAQIMQLRKKAHDRLDEIDVKKRDAAVDFLSSIEGYAKNYAFALTGKQLKYLCEIAAVSPRQFLVLETPYHEQFAF